MAASRIVHKTTPGPSLQTPCSGSWTFCCSDFDIYAAIMPASCRVSSFQCGILFSEVALNLQAAHSNSSSSFVFVVIITAFDIKEGVGITFVS